MPSRPSVRCLAFGGRLAPVGAIALGAIALGVAACSSIFGPDTGGGPLRTDRTEYTAIHEGGAGNYRQYSFELVALYTNDTGAPVYLSRCYPDDPHPVYGVELASGGESAYDAFWACVGHDTPIVVQPGEVRTDTLRLRAPNAWDGHTGKPFGAFTGAMRLIYDASSCPAEIGCKLPSSLRTSNTFTVRE